MRRLEGKRAIVTGAGRGFGAEIAELFARQGARVVASDIDGASADATARRIVEAGGEALGLQADVTSAPDAERLAAAAVERFSGLDVLVNNAGIASAGTVCEVAEEEWDRVMAINVKGTYLCSRFAVDPMARSGGGSIVCIASASGVIGQQGQVAYNVSKHAVIGLMRAAAADYGRYGIRSNAIAPSWVETRMARRYFEEEAGRTGQDFDKLYREGMGVGVLNTTVPPEAVAEMAVYLASDAGRHITGQTLSICGGSVMR